jgi:hypothetical protein
VNELLNGRRQAKTWVALELIFGREAKASGRSENACGDPLRMRIGERSVSARIACRLAEAAPGAVAASSLTLLLRAMFIWYSLISSLNRNMSWSANFFNRSISDGATCFHLSAIILPTRANTSFFRVFTSLPAAKLWQSASARGPMPELRSAISFSLSSLKKKLNMLRALVDVKSIIMFAGV